ncbi:MAG: DUF3301 domain-containing protein [Methylococcaceae bacterium]
MSFAYSELVIIALLLWFLVYWSNSLQVREIALKASKAYCEKMDVQLLDGYVALKALWLKRDKNGKLRAWRSYLFEFTATGEDRYNGIIVTLGKHVESIELEPYRIG